MLIVKAGDSGSRRQGAWQKGDVVAVVPHDHVFGKRELDPERFVIVEVSDRSAADPAWLEEELAEDGSILRRRSVRVKTAEVDAIKGEGGKRQVADVAARALIETKAARDVREARG